MFYYTVLITGILIGINLSLQAQNMFINRQFCRVTQTKEHRDLRQSVFFYYSKKA